MAINSLSKDVQYMIISMKKNILFVFAMALSLAFAYGQNPTVPDRPKPRPVPARPAKTPATPKKTAKPPKTEPKKVSSNNKSNAKSTKNNTNTRAKAASTDRSNGQWMDLGLPSGTLWKNANETNPNDSRGLYTFGEAVKKYDHSLPDQEQIEELLKHTKSQWATRNGVKGRLFTSKINGNSIFLPANGCQSSGSDNWSVYSSNVGVYYLYFNSKKVDSYFDFYYQGKLSVRLVNNLGKQLINS